MYWLFRPSVYHISESVLSTDYCTVYCYRFDAIQFQSHLRFFILGERSAWSLETRSRLDSRSNSGTVPFGVQISSFKAERHDLKPVKPVTPSVSCGCADGVRGAMARIEAGTGI